MKHAVLGAGGIGGLIGGLLAAGGFPVTLLLRRESLAAHPGHLSVQTPKGEVKAPVELRTTLDTPMDVLWIAVKAPQLESAIAGIDADHPPIGMIIPLLNGIDHVAGLRAQFGPTRVVPGTIAVEAERVAPGRIVQRTPFALLAISAAAQPQLEPEAARLREAGVTCDFHTDETSMLWRKLAFLAPFALTTTAADRPMGDVLADETWKRRLLAAAGETFAVAQAEGAVLDVERIVGMMQAAPAAMRSSMQKDVSAGRTPELDAIAGPILRSGAARGIDVSTVQELVGLIKERTARTTSNR